MTQSHQVVFLAMALLIVLLSRWLILRDGQAVGIPGTRFALPRTCVYRQLVGHDCPGCGLTRSFVSIAHGDLAGAWAHNPAGLLFFAVVVFQIPYRAIQVWRLSRGRPTTTCCSEHWVLWPLLIGLLAQWVMRLPNVWTLK